MSRKAPINEEELRILYTKRKMAGDKIADLFGVSSMTIYNRLRKLNIPIQCYSHTPWNKGKSKIDISPSELADLRSRYFIHEIASKFGVTNWVIWNLCDKGGIKIPIHKRFKEACANAPRSINGSNNSFYGKHHSEQTKKILSENATIRFANPENHPSWKGGLSFQEYGHEFNIQLRELIRKRDNYTCQMCGLPECENFRKLDIHHIDYNKRNNLPSNLVSLCVACNSKVNWHRGRWTKYFRSRNPLQSPLALGRIKSDYIV